MQAPSPGAGPGTVRPPAPPRERIEPRGRPSEQTSIWVASDIFAVVRRSGILVSLASVCGATGILACGIREAAPTYRTRDARFGYLDGRGDPVSKSHACSRWVTSVVSRDPHAVTHVSFPETNVEASCFVPVRHEGEDVASPIGATPRGCAFPNARSRARAITLAVELERVATEGAPHALLDCGLAEADRRAAALHNARVLRAVADEDASYPYAAIVVPGHGKGNQSTSTLLGRRPGEACRQSDDATLPVLAGMLPRTRRASALLRGRVAPIAIVSGAAVHSPLNESFAMLHLLSCARASSFAVPAERVLVEPCAAHTHTNLRNSGRWLDLLEARAGYVVTDDFLQSDYFQDSSGFELLMGSIDQRSLRDFGALLGAWRQASVGISSGFWFTPYRFWAEPREGLGAMTCVHSE